MVPYEGSALGDATQLLRTVAELITLGLVMAFSPTTFGIEIGTMEPTKQEQRRVATIAGGVALAATILAALFVVVTPNTLDRLWKRGIEPVVAQRWVDAAVGALLVLAGVAEWIRARRPRRPRGRSGRLDRPRTLLLVVLVNNLLSTTGPATMYLVVRRIGTAHPQWWPVEYAVFLIGLALPYAVLGVALTQFPAFSRRVAAVLASLSARDLRRPIAAALVAVGGVLLVWAVIALLRAR